MRWFVKFSVVIREPVSEEKNTSSQENLFRKRGNEVMIENLFRERKYAYNVEPISDLRHAGIGGIQDPPLDVIAIQSQQLV